MLSGAGAPFGNDKKIPRVSLSSVEVLEAPARGHRQEFDLHLTNPPPLRVFSRRVSEPGL